MFDRNPGPIRAAFTLLRVGCCRDTVNSRSFSIFLAMCSLKVGIKKNIILNPLKLAVINAPHFLRDMDQINPINWGIAVVYHKRHLFFWGGGGWHFLKCRDSKI